MLKKHSQLFEGLFVAVDLALVSLAWMVSYWLRFSSGAFPLDKGVPSFVDYAKLLIFVWLIWGFVFKKFWPLSAHEGNKRSPRTMESFTS